jgi:3-oxoacyl-[acyl-carrier protein] reductase
MTDELSDATKDQFLSRIPIGRIGAPEDIAHAALFLASDEANYITGQTITVDGGRIIN